MPTASLSNVTRWAWWRRSDVDRESSNSGAGLFEGAQGGQDGRERNRKAIRETPPAILVTNITMLEYLLLRAHLALPVPHNFLLDFMRPLRYGGQHGDSESGLT